MAPLQMDFSADWITVVDDVETVVLIATSGLRHTVENVLRRAVTQKELATSGGVYVPQDVVFLLPTIRLAPDMIPAPGYTISPQNLGTVGTDKDAQTRWTVLDVAGQCRDGNGYQVWACTSRNFVLTADLRDVIDIERAAITTDEAGIQQKAFPEDLAPGGTMLYAEVPARVQLLTAEQAEERGIRAFKRAYSVIVGQQVPALELEDRIKWTSGGVTQYLQVAGVHNPERIDELPQIDCFLPP